MTADRLDEQAEARIREACPRSDMPTHDPFACHFCRIQRAAILADREAREKRTFPIQLQRGAAPHPLRIPWSVAEKAYSVYAGRYGKEQTLETLAARGGFGPGEMDMYLPGWRDECDERAHADALAKMVRVLLDELDAYRSRERGCPCCDGHAPPYEDAETYHADDCSWVQADKLLAEHHRRRS